ncbi:MAG: Uma2 family endonuclease [Bacteroidia bacterium]
MYLVKDEEEVTKGTTVVQPDVCVICDSAKIQEKGCIGAPYLIIEIISPSTAKKDLNDKFDVYEEFGVKEYWVVFPGEKAINIYSLSDGQYELFKSYEKDDILQSPLFNQLKFKVDEVF